MKRYIRSATRPNKELAKTSKDPKVLTQLANDNDYVVRWHVANNSNTPANVLAQLANDVDENVRRVVTRNPSTSTEILAQLANDADYVVRWQVAESPRTPTAVLAQLANDENAFVRRYVAENPNTPADVLVQLAADENESVRSTVAKNPNCPVRSKTSSKSKKSPKWPSSDEWYNIESDEGFEDMWDSYLAGPEDEVNKQLQIFTEPSIQGDAGGMFIFDESGEDNEAFSIDFQYWCDMELNMAAESKNADEYKQKYTAFVEELVAKNWG